MLLKGKTINLRLIDETDAKFVLSLRLNERYNRFLSPVEADVDAQRQWIRQYKAEEAAGRQYYFIIERKDGRPCGTARVYNIDGKRCSLGSWILNADKSRSAAVESAILTYEFALHQLGLEHCHLDVMWGNDKVASFHTKMGALKTGEDETNAYFVVGKAQLEQIRHNFARFYPAAVTTPEPSASVAEPPGPRP